MPSAASPSVPANTAGASATASKLPSLTGLRWLAAFLVFGFHVGTLNLIQTRSYHHKWDMVFGQGAAGVSFFFVLSGFVLVWSARPGDTVLRFWRRRVAKIFPNHVVMWAVVIAVAVLYWGDTVRGDYAIGNLFLLQPWINSGTFPYSINSVSWSLGCELFFYLCFPFVLPLVRRAPVWLLYGCAVAMPVLLWRAGKYTVHLPDHDRFWFTYMFPPVRSTEFWLGVVVGELVVRRRWNGPGVWGGTAAAVVVYTATRGIAWFPLGMPPEWWGPNLDVGFVLLIAGAARADITGAWSPWRNRQLVFLGEISFAFYMVHVFFMQTVLRWLGRGGVGWSASKAVVVILGFLGTAILLAWLLYRFVETPMMRVLGPKRRTAVAPVAPEAGGALSEPEPELRPEPSAPALPSVPPALPPM